MKKLTMLSTGLCLLFIGSSIASAQDTMGPPKVLIIQREFLKPGRAGSMHLKTEGAFVRAMVAAKWPTHYLGMDSLSGPSRSLFFIGYPSFEAWEKDNSATQNNATLSAAFDRAIIADGDLLNLYESSAFVYREDLSLRAASVNIAQMRYFEIMQFVIRPGHEKEWGELVKIYTDGYNSIPDTHWAVYESQYGAANGGVFIVLNPMKSLAEVDSGFGDAKKFMGSMSESEAKKMAELTAACVESVQVNLFAFNPKESYPDPEWIKADPFWKPKPTAAAAKPAP